MNSIFFLVLRRMRAPIIGLIVIYAIAVIGLTLVPGVDAQGQPAPPLSFFHAFYFVSYTATTIGFGEIPGAFSDAQRMWVTLCIYLTVVGWSYSVVTLIGLLQDKGFQNTITRNRFARRVRRLREPFYLICGCGETGNLIARALDHSDRAFVVLEKDELRVEELDLLDFKTDKPALAADARHPEILLLAGLRHPKCCGVLAVTNDEEANLAIAIAVRLLNPIVPVIAKASTLAIQANMASFGTHHIVNPFERFAEHLALAVSSPARFRLIETLTGLPESHPPTPHHPPKGHWILCGYGRFGHALAEHLGPAGITLTIIDPDLPDTQHTISGNGTEAATLRAAGIDQAVGIIAGSNNDINNLSIAMTASELKPSLFVVTRQNHHANASLFKAYSADFTMVASHIMAQESIALLMAPLLARFLNALNAQNESWCDQLNQRLVHCNAGRTPLLREVHLNPETAPAVLQALHDGTPVSVGILTGKVYDEDISDRSLALLLVRAGVTHLLPDAETPVQPGDQLLIACSRGDWSRLELSLRNANELAVCLTGREPPGWLWQKLVRLPPSV